ncbi:1,4-alpha-glucan branching enzyme [Monoraphidium neglectum]|uniref:1,4-alpha-glucan branching enzyme n=1 Tax=Monoraphidium neglectum TaxID=145388 RepID=A0A0D2L2Q9_9CHLO|nr:1,4-alpha-glucan branching enzyme [Monoraphidium neglectum]KIZ01544.1 1,4-alpha-glucan branching enzyme [Monoraphidium neglectum]|eukprot:XP_013900563.1 1,4-alpha-glucan branching enzyme [Monoraphidium neglectum]
MRPLVTCAPVGDKTIAMWLMDAEMYTGMSTLGEATPVISRGIAMHKLIRMVTMALGGEAWLNFMGNEFGHPEWLDFPREGNNWSHFYCRRQWSLADADHLRYRHLLEWDKAMNQLDDTTGFLADPWQWVLVAERGPVVFVFNFSPHTDHEGLKVATPEPGKWRVIIDSDDPRFGGQGRVGHDTDHFTSPAAEAGEAELKEGRFHDRDQFMQVLAPARTVVGYTRVKEEQEEAFIAAAANAGTVSPSDDDDGTSSAAAAAATAATAAPAAGPGAPAAAPHAPAAPAAAPEAPAAVTAPAANAQLPAGWGPAAAAPAAAPPAAVKAAPAAAPGPAAAPAPAQPAEGPSVEPEDPPSSSRPPSPVKLAKVVEKSEFVIYSFDDADHHNQVDDLSG